MRRPFILFSMFLLCQVTIARIYQGAVSSALSPFIASFAFGPKGGTIAISGIDDSAAGVSFLAVDDIAWPADCTSSHSGVTVTELNPDAINSILAPPKSLPSFIYMALCSAPGASCATLPVSTHYLIDARQTDGSQLSYNEQGLPALYGVFFALAAAQLAFHVYTHYRRGARFAPGLVRAFTATLALHCMSDMLHMIDWAAVSSTGKSNVNLAAVAGVFRLAAQTSQWTAAALVAVGFGITSAEMAWFVDFKAWAIVHYKGVVLFTSLVLVYFFVAVVYAGGNTGTLGGGGRTDGGNAAAAVMLVVLTLAYILWFARKSAATRAAEVNLTKRALLTRLTTAYALCFITLPVAEFFGE